MWKRLELQRLAVHWVILLALPVALLGACTTTENSSSELQHSPQSRNDGLADGHGVVDVDARTRCEGNTREDPHRTRVETTPAEYPPPDAETTRRTGAVTTPWTNRASERPYRLPPEYYIVVPGRPMPELDPYCVYLWVVDTEGRIIVAPELQAGFGRPVKHRDLLPAPDGHPGPGRAGGEFRFDRGDGQWIMDNNSSMTFRRNDRTHTGEAELRASYDLLRQSGTDVTTITYSNTHGRDTPW